MQGAFGNIPDGRWTPEGWSDIRCDEDYERFYQSQAESGRKLPPPLDNRTVYAQLPPHLQQQLTQQQQQALAARLSPAPAGRVLSPQCLHSGRQHLIPQVIHEDIYNALLQVVLQSCVELVLRPGVKKLCILQVWRPSMNSGQARI